MGDLTAIFKAYDVRGLVPSQLDDQVAHDIGLAFAAEVAAVGARQVVIGHDMRASSPGLAAAFADGVQQYGSDAVMIGLASTDMVYFASGWLDLPAAMFTASHNPAAYNGIKLCRAGAVALSEDTGLGAIRIRACEAGPSTTPAFPRGALEDRDLLAPYAAYLNALVPLAGRRLHVVVDAGNGMAGLTVPAVFESLDLRVTALYFDLDGTFPNHEANPLQPANLVDLQTTVVREGADLGLAFDGDADRCFVVDEQGRVVSPSALTALIAVRLLANEPDAHVIHNLITSRAVPEIIARHGGVPVRTRVGHSLIKATMASTNAVFGGEHSGHYYFRDFWFADSGILAALHLLAELAAGDVPVSSLVADYQPYTASGEINATVTDVAGVLDTVLTAFVGVEGVTFDHLDGHTVSSPHWWFNVRPSNTEPVVRLNVEADDEPTMQRVRDEVLSLVGGEPHD
jgi:phosphomannomutase